MTQPQNFARTVPEDENFQRRALPRKGAETEGATRGNEPERLRTHRVIRKSGWAIRRILRSFDLLARQKA